jgi:hypothetical protein
MPNVTYDGQSFLINGRRQWLVGASIQYSLTPPSTWPSLIAAAKQAGFNLIDASVPWNRHEPRPGRFDFAGMNDLRRFVMQCGAAGLKVLLRVGPNIGAAFDGGGLPPWLHDVPRMKIREGNDVFLERVSAFFHKLFEQVSDLQVTTQDGPSGREGGPLLLVQFEHGWHCSNDVQGQKYLRELGRYVRECGITTPLLTANDLWQDVEGAIETWTGCDDLLVNLRQLRAVQSHAPRIATVFDADRIERWGSGNAPPITPTDLVQRLGQVLASGAQPILTGFHAGLYSGFGAGRLSGENGGFATPRIVGGLVDEAGRRTEGYSTVKRLVSFAASFGHVFAELDPDYHPVSIDVSRVLDGDPKSRAQSPGLLVVPLRGSQGSIVFVFSGPNGPRSTTLLLENGMRMPVHLGDQSLGWYVLDVDLQGRGRLDYSNLCPVSLINRSILVMQGPEKSSAYLSIDGTPIEATVPTGMKPMVIEQKGITVVICNQTIIDRAYEHDGSLILGIDGLDAEGHPYSSDNGRAMVVKSAADVKTMATKPLPRSGGRVTLAPWAAVSQAEHAAGTSARYATLEGPATLVSCGASTGYGWYRVTFKSGARKSRLVHVPDSGGRLHIFADGKFLGVFGEGSGARPFPATLPLGGGLVYSVLADNFGNFADGGAQQQKNGLYGHLLDVSPMRSACKRVTKDPVDPFTVKGFIWGRAAGQTSDREQVEWKFKSTRSRPALISIAAAKWSGTFLLNDKPLRHYPGVAGPGHDAFLLNPAENDLVRNGANTLRYAPDPQHPPAGARTKESAVDEMVKALKIYAVDSSASKDASWSFAKWEPPAEPLFNAAARQGVSAREAKGVPCWWRTTFTVREAAPLRLDLTGLSKGQVFVNGLNLARYFTASAEGKKVGPPTAVVIPAAWLRADAENEIVLFDEHGFSTKSVKLGPC